MLVSEVREVSRSKEAVFITHGIDLLANFGRCHVIIMLGTWQICNAKLTSRLRNSLSTPSADRRMSIKCLTSLSWPLYPKIDRFGLHSLSPRTHCQAPSGAFLAAWMAIPVASSAISPAKNAFQAAWIALLCDLGCDPCRLDCIPRHFDCNPNPFEWPLSDKEWQPSRPFSPTSDV